MLTEYLTHSDPEIRTTVKAIISLNELKEFNEADKLLEMLITHSINSYKTILDPNLGIYTDEIPPEQYYERYQVLVQIRTKTALEKIKYLKNQEKAKEEKAKEEIVEYEEKRKKAKELFEQNLKWLILGASIIIAALLI